ncbi:hypothetical protein Nwi_0723 [Nitrobacter winogradskyi Nb-255]|uniref:Uncharacterized protein n=1 Tax=Nitrobacter winogradskyi (strain ATCC 25391 / DSM 10237 / CIP 104748 / NCIMB 11846 / Nb-255) TaxID=323098 RepID=Q3SUQ2_NITWN|nr:sigma factor [Nitrobacter winogradskyi]ABA03989.1 hypothetical protein Nwi_0723 [Nitrobacter winogradskyi Nb-255]
MQETFLKLLTAKPTAPVDNVQAYIFRTANNLSIDLARRQRLMPLVDNSDDVLNRLSASDRIRNGSMILI